MISLGILLLVGRIYGDACSEQCVQQGSTSGYQNIGKILNGTSGGMGMSACSLQPPCAITSDVMPQMSSGLTQMSSVGPSLGQQSAVTYPMMPAQAIPAQYVQPSQMIGGGDCGTSTGGSSGGMICQQQSGSSGVGGGSPWQTLQQPNAITIETYCPQMSNPGGLVSGGNGGGMSSSCFQGPSMPQTATPQQPQMLFYNPPLQPSQGNYVPQQSCVQQSGQSMVGGGIGSSGGNQIMPSECVISQSLPSQQQPVMSGGMVGSSNGPGQFISPCTMASLQSASSIGGGANSDCIAAGMMPNVNTVFVGKTGFLTGPPITYATSTCSAENFAGKTC